MTIEIKNLSAGYEQGIPVLQNINLTVATGESVAVVGANGAGKSTLLSVLLGFLPYEGQITIQDLKLKPENYANIRAKMGMLFQNPDDQIFQGRIVDDIAFGPRNYGVTEAEIKKRTQTVLSTLGRLDLLEKYTYKVSFGEKKIAALAGLLVMEPEILLLDEPTSALDPRARKQFIEYLGSLKQTRLVVTHDLDMVFHVCSRVVLMNHGRFVASGTPKKILTNRELLLTNGLELPRCLENI
jgi:cobalt/nickel transport system ATP-binding protein